MRYYQEISFEQALKRVEAKMDWPARMKHRVYKYRLIISILLFGVAGIAFCCLKIDNSMKVTFIGSIIILWYNLEKQHLEEARMFQTLFDTFNQKFADWRATEPPDQEAYLDLCAEEFLYFKKGYVFPEVFASWLLGMPKYLEPFGRRQPEQYYGFNPNELFSKSRPNSNSNLPNCHDVEELSVTVDSAIWISQK